MSGTPPADMLCSEWAEQVAGDANTPIYQPADQFGHTISGPDLAYDGGLIPRQVEAYHWGEMTSGGWSKAIWALLGPFALVNVAQWMLPPSGERRFHQILIGILEALLRLAGLLLTALFMAQAAVLVMDVVVHQCPHTCLSSVRLDWLWKHQRLLSIAGALVLTAVLGVINQISKIKWTPLATTTTAHAPGKVLAEDDSFYTGDADAPLLRATHLTAGFSVVVVLLLRGTNPPSGWQMLVWWVAVVQLFGSGLGVLLLRNPRNATRGPRVPTWLSTWAWWAGPRLALVLLLVTAAFGPTASAVPAGRASTGHPRALPGSDDVVGLAMLFLTGAVILIVVALALALIINRGNRAATPSAFRPFIFGGFAAPIAILAGLLAAGLGAGYTYIAAGCLSGKCAAVFSSKYGAGYPIRLPPTYESLSELWAITGIVIAAGFLLLVLVFLAEAGLAAIGQRVPAHLRPAAVIEQASGAGSRFRAALSWQLPRWRVLSARLVTGLSVAIGVAAILCLEAQWATRHTHLLRPLSFLLDRGFLTWPASVLSLDQHRAWLAALGAYVVTVVTLGFLLRVYNAARNPDSARTLGILWDLASYWPRAAHPFVPPCYAQKAVPELVERAHSYITEGHRVVLSAHSQGSLITIAAALRMKICYGDSCERLGLVMAGSQLQWAYARAFPAVVDLGAYQRVLDDLDGRWYVLARGTDPLGGPVLSWNLRESGGNLTAGTLSKKQPGDEEAAEKAGEEEAQPVNKMGAGLWVADHDWWISDPMPATPDDTGFALPPFSTATERHSGYWSHPRWDQAVARAAGLNPPEPGG